MGSPVKPNFHNQQKVNFKNHGGMYGSHSWISKWTRGLGSQGIFQTNKLSNFKNHGNLIILNFEVNRGVSLPSLKSLGPHMRKSGMTFLF
jgi:hypothetical protein